MNKQKISKIAEEIIAREFEDLNDNERREYLRDHPDSRWNPGQAKLPPKKKRRRK